MALPIVPILVLTAGYYAWADYDKKKKAKYKADKTVEELIDDAANEGLAVIIWGDIDNCSDWYLTEDWIAEVAQPRFDDHVSGMVETGAVFDEGQAHVTEITRTILDDQLPSTCPVPEGDYFVLQTDYPDQPNFYPGSQSTVYLYQDVHNAVLWASEDLATGGEGVLYDDGETQ